MKFFMESYYKIILFIINSWSLILYNHVHCINALKRLNILLLFKSVRVMVIYAMFASIWPTALHKDDFMVKCSDFKPEIFGEFILNNDFIHAILKHLLTTQLYNILDEIHFIMLIISGSISNILKCLKRIF